ncbi:hypothetical protein LCGC14_3022970, partial [marine sediment metagenome]
GWQGLSLVRDQRLVRNLKRGATQVRFTDVPTGILPDTVRLRSLDDADSLTILEQNYQYDLASAQTVLKRYMDRPITVDFKKGGRVSGTLLSFDSASIVIQPAGQGPRTLTQRQVKCVILPKLPKGLLTRPTLVWELANRAGHRQQFEVAYMTTGLKWRADYVLKLHPARQAPQPKAGEMPQVFDSADLVGYATVTNNSGISYRDAQLKLMAGDVNLIRPEELESWNYGFQASSAIRGGGARVPQFKEKSFFEYHLYTLGRPTTLGNAETKQIELVSGAGLKLRRAYLYDRTSNATAVRVASEFKNSKANGLGKPLPKGIIRLYAPDPTGLPTYVSQTSIDHTPKNEKIRLLWGHAFDIAC